MMKKMQSLLSAAAVALVAVTTVHSATIYIDASQDTFLRSNNATNRGRNYNYGSPFNSVGGLITGSTYFPLVQFDLSAVAGKTITNAYIQGRVFKDSDGDYNLGDHGHQMYLAKSDPNNAAYDGGMDETTMTWNLYLGIWNDFEELMEGLGSYEGDAQLGEYTEFGSATAADLVHLNTQASLSNLNQRFALFFVEFTSNWRWWDDHEENLDADGNPMAYPMQLVVEVVPEPVSFALIWFGVVMGGCLGRRTRYQRIGT